MTRDQFAEVIELAVLFANMVSKMDGGEPIEMEHLFYQDGILGEDEMVIRVRGLEDDFEN